MVETKPPALEIGLTAAIVAIENNEPTTLVASDQEEGEPRAGLPSGPFDPLSHRTFEIGLHAWVEAQSGLRLGYVEQLYTFGDRGRHVGQDAGPHVVSVGYLALTRVPDNLDNLRTSQAGFEPWYRFFPWEDWRKGRPEILDSTILPLLEEWAQGKHLPEPNRTLGRQERLRLYFGFAGSPWDEEKVLDRYELLYEAGLVEEARRDGRQAVLTWQNPPHLGSHMQFDHRRILATAIGRMRGKIKYRPVVFEMMADEFTLFELQRTVEAILGPHLHKQNFRRLIEGAGLVEPTGEVRAKTGGRPAKLFRFRREVLLERPAPGVRVKSGRS